LIKTNFHFALFGFVISFLFTLINLEIAAKWRMKYIADTISDSNRLVFYTSIYKEGVPSGQWKKEITDLNTLRELSTILRNGDYEFSFCCGAFGTNGWADIYVYNKKNKLNIFYILERFDFGFSSIMCKGEAIKSFRDLLLSAEGEVSTKNNGIIE
jgi:hypothetical protein